MEKIKGILKNSLESKKGKDVLIVIIVVLVGFISFELGRLSINQSSGIKIEYPEGEAVETNNPANVISAAQIPYTAPKTMPTATGKAFFASSRGKKYYSIGCSAGKTIVQENRIYFNTEAEAIAAGYSKSTSCK